MFCGSGSCWMWGVRGLLDAIAAWGQAGEKTRQDGQLSGVVYQITHDKTMGRVAHVRLFGGGNPQPGYSALFPPRAAARPRKGRSARSAGIPAGRWVDAGFAGPGQTAAFVRPCGHPRRGIFWGR